MGLVSYSADVIVQGGFSSLAAIHFANRRGVFQAIDAGLLVYTLSRWGPTSNVWKGVLAASFAVVFSMVPVYQL